MAGVKGRSGGARTGSGRKPRNRPGAEQSVAVEMEPQPHGGALKRARTEPVPQAEKDMLQFLQDVALGHTEATNLQVRAAIAAAQYLHVKRADGGKKDELADKAKQAGGGKFKAAPPPLKLVANAK